VLGAEARWEVCYSTLARALSQALEYPFRKKQVSAARLFRPSPHTRHSPLRVSALEQAPNPQSPGSVPEQRQARAPDPHQKQDSWLLPPPPP
jgi:hypothetical protein